MPRGDKRRGDITKFWNKRSQRYSESLKHNDRSMQMISRLDIGPECTVLISRDLKPD